jgi:hypothetical protein
MRASDHADTDHEVEWFHCGNQTVTPVIPSANTNASPKLLSSGSARSTDAGSLLGWGYLVCGDSQRYMIPGAYPAEMHTRLSAVVAGCVNAYHVDADEQYDEEDAHIGKGVKGKTIEKELKLPEIAKYVVPRLKDSDPSVSCHPDPSDTPP